MPIRIPFALSLAGFLAINLSGGALSAGEPTAQELVRKTSVISSHDKGRKSIVIGGYGGGNARALLRFRATYQAPDRYSLIVRDGVDDTPVLAAVDGKLLIYDPVRPVVLFGEAENVMLWMGAEADTLKWGVKWNFGDKEPSQIRVDLNSLLTAQADQTSVFKVTDHEYRLTQKRESTLLNFYHDVSRNGPCSCRRVELIRDDEERPWFCLNEIAVDEGVGESDFVIPSRDALSRRLDTRDIHGDSLLQRVGGMALMLRAVYTRLAANQPELREEIERSLLAVLKIDWDRVHENNEAFSRVLREVTAPRSK